MPGLPSSAEQEGWLRLIITGVESAQFQSEAARRANAALAIAGGSTGPNQPGD